MKREERIYEYIQAQSRELAQDDFKGRIGFDAQEVASALDILRNNVSKELNSLYRQGLLVKFLGRPVRYFDKDELASRLGVTFAPGPCQLDAVEDIRPADAEKPTNPFPASSVRTVVSRNRSSKPKPRSFTRRMGCIP